MMKQRNEINFFDAAYHTEEEQTTMEIGIVDAKPAYTTDDISQKWNATIKNPNGKTFIFVPIDFNIEIDRGDGQKESSCDGMVLCDSEKFIAFVELKDVKNNGDSDARKQLKITIQIFNENHDYKVFSRKNRRAYVANVTHPHFHSSKTNDEEEFRDKLHFRLFQQTDIEIP